MIDSKKWKTIPKKEMAIIKGGGFMNLWALSLITIVIFKMITTSKASLAINGFGRGSWDEGKCTTKKNNQPNDNAEILNQFITKFYEV